LERKSTSKGKSYEALRAETSRYILARGSVQGIFTVGEGWGITFGKKGRGRETMWRSSWRGFPIGGKARNPGGQMW